MSTLLKRKGLLPGWNDDLFNTERFFSRRLPDFTGMLPSMNFSREPSVNIRETEKEFLIEMAAPGLERKDFKVELENGNLTISTEKEEEQTEAKSNYTRREYSYNSFSRSFTLPDNCEAEKINAKYNNGILQIILPKKEVSATMPAKEIKVS
jgi:HSP20 family protein